MIYHTTFCNFGHDLATGRPVDHECYILDAAKLLRERNGDKTVFKEDMKKQPPKIIAARKRKG